VNRRIELDGAVLVAEKAIEFECGQRYVRRLKPEVVEVEAKGDEQHGLLREGSVLSIVGPSSGSGVADAVGALASGDDARAAAASERLLDQQRKGIEALRGSDVTNQEVFVDVFYRALPIAKKVTLLPGADAGVEVAVWNGAPLDHGLFTAKEYVRSPDAEPAQVTVVCVRPQLSELERAVVGKVAPHEEDMQLLGPPFAYAGAMDAVRGVGAQEAAGGASEEPGRQQYLVYDDRAQYAVGGASTLDEAVADPGEAVVGKDRRMIFHPAEELVVVVAGVPFKKGDFERDVGGLELDENDVGRSARALLRARQRALDPRRR
jgi:hypothetical protein